MDPIPINPNLERNWQIERNSQLASFLEERLVISTHKFIHLPRISDILYVRSENNYSKIFLADSREILVSKTLKHVSELLIARGFLRIHSSYLINLSKVTGIRKNGNLFIELDRGIKIPISAKYKAEILDTIRNTVKL